MAPPGRILAAARTHTFRDLAEAIDGAFARWDLAHLHEFRLGDGRVIGFPDDEFDREVLDDRRTKLSTLRPGERFGYVFDLGDDWTHACTVNEARVDPLEVLGIHPDHPLPYWGWGDIPDQYGRRWDGDDGSSEPPAYPGPAALPGMPSSY